jgi:hypothetical protein
LADIGDRRRVFVSEGVFRGGADARRLISAVAVLALHFGLVTLFLAANYTRTSMSGRFEEIEIRFPPPPARAPASPAPVLQPKFLSPSTPVIPAIPGQLFAPPEQAAPPAPGAIFGVGRALFGCDPQKRDTLSAQERAACQRISPHAPPQQTVRLGPAPDPNSPFTKEIEERFQEAVPINRPCPLGSFNDVHGLPCFAFDQEAPLLPHR